MTTNDTLPSANSIVLADASGADRTHTLPDGANIMNEPFIVKKISRDFRTITFSRAGSTALENPNNLLTTPTATTVKAMVPDEVLQFIPTTNNTYRLISRYTPTNRLRGTAYRGTVDFSVSGSATIDVPFWSRIDDRINAIDSSYGFDLANYWFKAPCDMDWYIFAHVLGAAAGAGTSFNIRLLKSTDNGATFPTTLRVSNTARPSSTADDAAMINGIFTLNKDEIVKVQITNLTPVS